MNAARRKWAQRVVTWLAIGRKEGRFAARVYRDKFRNQEAFERAFTEAKARVAAR